MVLGDPREKVLPPQSCGDPQVRITDVEAAVGRRSVDELCKHELEFKSPTPTGEAECGGSRACDPVCQRQRQEDHGA